MTIGEGLTGAARAASGEGTTIDLRSAQTDEQRELRWGPAWDLSAAPERPPDRRDTRRAADRPGTGGGKAVSEFPVEWQLSTSDIDGSFN